MTSGRFPVFCEGVFAPACFRTNLFLTYIVTPAAARDAAGAAHQQNVDDGAVGVIGLEPLVDACPHQHAGAALSLGRGSREFSSECDGVLCFDAGDLFLPSRCERNVVGVALGAFAA